MNISQDKTISLSEAVTKFVFSGCHLSIGGFTASRNPMAAVYEIIRQKISNIHLYAHSNGQGVDELIGAGCVSRLEIAYAGTGRFAPTCVRFKKAAQSGAIAIEDYSNYQMTLRFMAGAMGVPFLPTRSSLGTDIIEKWGAFPVADFEESADRLQEELCRRIEEATGVEGRLIRGAIRGFVEKGYIRAVISDGECRWHWTHNNRVDRLYAAGLNR